MISGCMLTVATLLAEMVSLDKGPGESTVAQQAGQVTVAWTVFVLVLLGLLLVAFRKSKRTHLD